MNSHTVVYAQLTAAAAEAVTPNGFDTWDARATTPDGVPRLPRRAAGFVNRAPLG